MLLCYCANFIISLVHKFNKVVYLFLFFVLSINIFPAYKFLGVKALLLTFKLIIKRRHCKVCVPFCKGETKG